MTLRRPLCGFVSQDAQMEAIGTMAGGVAHNFRNILAVVSMNSELIRMKYENEPALKEVQEKFRELFLSLDNSLTLPF